MALQANGDLAFKGRSTNCSVGLNFWSENLLSAGDITGEASLSPLLLPSHADPAALGGQEESGAGKTAPNLPQTNDVAAGGSGGFGATLQGCLSPGAFPPSSAGRPPGHRDLRVPVTHSCHGSAPCKAFPVGSC